MTPLVTAVVPTKDVARTLAACLESIRAQDIGPVQVVVVDNDSTDGTYEHRDRGAGGRRRARRSGAQCPAQHAASELAGTRTGCCGSTPTWCSPPTTVVRLALGDRRGARARTPSRCRRSASGPASGRPAGRSSGPATSTTRRCTNPRLLRRDYLLLGDGGVRPGDGRSGGRRPAAAAARGRGTRTAYCAEDVLITHDEGRLTLRSILSKTRLLRTQPAGLRGEEPGRARRPGRRNRCAMLVAALRRTLAAPSRSWTGGLAADAGAWKRPRTSSATGRAAGPCGTGDPRAAVGVAGRPAARPGAALAVAAAGHPADRTRTAPAAAVAGRVDARRPTGGRCGASSRPARWPGSGSWTTLPPAYDWVGSLELCSLVTGQVSGRTPGGTGLRSRSW